jgi:hypothetical protein
VISRKRPLQKVLCAQADIPIHTKTIYTVIYFHSFQQKNMRISSAFLSIVLLLFSSQLLTAQDVQWGPEMKKSSRWESLRDVISVNDNGLFAYTYTKKGPAIQLYNESFALKKQEQIDLKYNKKSLDYDGMLEIGGKIYAFGTFDNKKDKKTYIFNQEISQKTLLPTGKLTKIGDATSRKRGLISMYNDNSGSFSKKLSDNEKRLMIISNDNVKKKDNESFQISVFDETMNLDWTKEVKLPYQEKEFMIQSWTLGNDGSVYILGKRNKEKSEQKKDWSKYEYLVLAYTNKGKSYKEFKLDKKDRFLSDLAFKVDEDGNLVCAGFYSDPDSYGLIGTFFMLVEAKTQKVLKQGEKRFDDDFLREFMSKKQKRKDDKGKDAKKGLSRFDLDKLVLTADGGAVLIAEQFYITTHTYRDSNGNTSTYRMYHYNDIIVVSIEPDGSIAWASKIDKSQSGRSSRYLSYTYVINSDNIHILYNRWDSRKTSKVVQATIDSEGAVKTKDLMYSSKKEVLLIPSSCEQVDNGELIIYGDFKKIFKLGLVSY